MVVTGVALRRVNSFGRIGDMQDTTLEPFLSEFQSAARHTGLCDGVSARIAARIADIQPLAGSAGLVRIGVVRPQRMKHILLTSGLGKLQCSEDAEDRRQLWAVCNRLDFRQVKISASQKFGILCAHTMIG